MMHFATARFEVNATNKNKRILIGRRRFGRMNSPGTGRARKQCFPTIFAPFWAIALQCKSIAGVPVFD
jgi:hypothetical protein